MVITEAMIEAACRAAVAAGNPQADADMQTPRKGGPGTETIWEAWRYVIEPALKAALDCAATPDRDYWRKLVTAHEARIAELEAMVESWRNNFYDNRATLRSAQARIAELETENTKLLHAMTGE